MSRRARQLRRRRAQAGPTRAVFVVLGVLAATAILSVCAGVGYIVSVAGSAPDITELKAVDQGATSVVYASDGKTRLAFIQGDTLRTPVSSSAMPLSVRNATVAIEDRRFYKHGGVDFEGIVRAAIKNVSSGETCRAVRRSRCSSCATSTAATARAMASPATSARSARRSSPPSSRIAIPGMRGKRWVLTQYLNNVPYGTVGGQTAVGIQAASRVFFDKPASRLKLAEAALLAGLPQAPSDYNPFLDPTAARLRRNDVLDQMQRAGYISARTAATRQARSARRAEERVLRQAPRELLRRLRPHRAGQEVRRRRACAQGGLKVYTTIDLKLQQVARKAIANRLPNPGDPSAAMVSMDPKTGYIKAMASSGDYAASKFNLAAQGKRQPGSTFKVMVMMTALRQGVDIHKTTYDSKPLNFIDKKTGAKIEVNTDDHRYGGSTPIFEGLVKSDNTVFQQLDLDLGPENVRQTAYDMGITSHLDAYPAEGLGGLRIGVSPLEMTRAYTTINTGGWRVKPVAVTKVVFPDGRVDTSLGRQKRVKVFTDGQTHEATLAMEANVQRGTGTNAQLGCPAAGKTGTTSSFTDAWFDGFTTSLNTAVWVGYPNATTSMTAVPGYGEMFGGLAPALIWHDFMATAMENRKCGDFPEPKEPFVSAPFFGEYASTGAPGGGDDPLAKDEEQTTGGAPGAKDKKDKKDKKDFPPSQYESPPQPAPKTDGTGTDQQSAPVSPTGGVVVG